MAVAGVGRFYAWEGGSLFIGRSTAEVPTHAHHAAQICIAAEHGVRFRASDDEPWTSYDGVFIHSHQPHAMDATGVAAVAVLLVEPETPEGRTLAARYVVGGIVPVPAEGFARVGTALLDLWLAGGAPEAVVAAARRVVAELAGRMPPQTPTDVRVLRAIAHLRSRLDAPHTLEEVAAVACLSPDRFRHLLVEETGMRLRTYVLWLRLLRAWELAMNGSSLTAAAHAAGFADAAHLTRTCRRMLGVSPSMLQAAEGPNVARADAAYGVVASRSER
jgi:AraC-like DNA-binding protein